MRNPRITLRQLYAIDVGEFLSVQSRAENLFFRFILLILCVSLIASLTIFHKKRS